MRHPMQRVTPLIGRTLFVVLVIPIFMYAQTSEPAAALDRELRAAVERGEVPGLVVIAGNRDGVIYERAFGLAESAAKRAMTTDAIFRIASMTKPATSVALM